MMEIIGKILFFAFIALLLCTLGAIKEAPLVERTEFTLVDRSKTPPREWTIGVFIPLTLADTREGRAVAGVSGIPIATDIEKGTYFLDPAGAVRLYSPNAKGNEAQVASSIGELAAFEVKPDSDDDE